MLTYMFLLSVWKFRSEFCDFISPMTSYSYFTVFKSILIEKFAARANESRETLIRFLLILVCQVTWKVIGQIWISLKENVTLNSGIFLVLLWDTYWNAGDGEVERCKKREVSSMAKGRGVGHMGKYVEGKKDGFLFGGVYYIFC